MFMAPGLYLVHALLTGISATICALLPFRLGFNFSAGFVDWFLSFKAPMALNPWLILPIGAVYAAVYYFVFRFVILKFNLKTPGREDDDDEEAEKDIELANDDFTAIAKLVLEGLGGKDNIKEIDYCATRVRAEVADYVKVDEKTIKKAGIAGVIRPSKSTVQVIVGPKVQFVYDEIKKLM